MEFQVSTSGATFHQRGHQSVRRFWTFPLDWWRCIDMHQLLLQLWFAFGHLSCHPCLLALFSFYHWQPVWLLFLVLSTTDWLRNHHTGQSSPVPNEPLKGHLRSTIRIKVISPLAALINFPLYSALFNWNLVLIKSKGNDIETPAIPARAPFPTWNSKLSFARKNLRTTPVWRSMASLRRTSTFSPSWVSKTLVLAPRLLTLIPGVYLQSMNAGNESFKGLGRRGRQCPGEPWSMDKTVRISLEPMYQKWVSWNYVIIYILPCTRWVLSRWVSSPFLPAETQ